MEELWKPIEGYPDYEISSLGRVKSKTFSKQYLKPYSDGRYLCVRLWKDKTIPKNNIKVHHLVAKAFIENPENKPTIDHINRDKKDNRVENLRWATLSEQAWNRRTTVNTPPNFLGMEE